MKSLPEPLRIKNAGLIQMASGLVVLIILVTILQTLKSFLQPLFFAIFFFYITDPLIKALKKRRVPSFLAYLVPLFLVISVLFTMGWIIGVHVDDLVREFPNYRKKLQLLFQGSMTWVFDNLPMVGDRLKQFLSAQTIPLAPIEALIKTVLGNFFGFVSFSLLVVFFLIFILQESVSLPKRLESAYGVDKASQIMAVGNRINHGIIGYVYVKGLASLGVAILSTVTLLAFRVDLALLWGALTFFGNFIPYLGSALAVAFPVIIALLQFETLGAVIALLLILVGCQILVSNFLEPNFAGLQLNLSPLVVLLSLAFWGWLWGVVGLVLSIPIMVSVKFILENIPATHDIALVMSHVTTKKPKPNSPTQ